MATTVNFPGASTPDLFDDLPRDSPWSAFVDQRLPKLCREYYHDNVVQCAIVAAMLADCQGGGGPAAGKEPSAAVEFALGASDMSRRLTGSDGGVAEVVELLVGGGSSTTNVDGLVYRSARSDVGC